MNINRVWVNRVLAAKVTRANKGRRRLHIGDAREALRHGLRELAKLEAWKVLNLLDLYRKDR